MAVFRFGCVAFLLLVHSVFAFEGIEDNCASRSSDDPNLLHIVLDQLRYDCIRFIQDRMPEYDGFKKIQTPNMDRLFSRSAVFEHAYCLTPVCTPARAALKTGMVLQRSGQNTNEVMHRHVYSLEPSLRGKVEKAKTFEHILKEIGYQVETYGKWHTPLVWNDDRYGNPVIDNDYYDFENESFGRMPSQLFATKYQKFAPYLIERDGQDVAFNETWPRRNRMTGYPYQKLGMTKGGRDKLHANYTYTGVLGQMASKALERLLASGDPFAMGVHFLAPHKPWVANDYHLEKYYNQKMQLHVPASLHDPMSNSAYFDHNPRKRWEGSDRKRQIHQSVYYALITEVDDWIGVLLDQVDAAGLTKCTLISLTSDHGEMMGAHGLMSKYRFYDEAGRVPLSFSLPGVIPVGVVREVVSHLDSVATILDYLNAGQYDVSDGKSLRRYLDYQGINEENREECFVVSEIDKRYPIKWRTFRRKTVGNQPEFMLVHRGFKLMLPKVANSSTLDMMFDLRDDPHEMNNLIGNRGHIASDAVIGRAEHLKSLLLEYMRYHNGEDKIYSDPSYYQYQTAGDIREINRRCKWRKVPLWVSESETMTFGRPFYDPSSGRYRRSEYLYVGRTAPGVVDIERILFTGPDKDLFKTEVTWSFRLTEWNRRRIRIVYENPLNIDTSSIDAGLVIDVLGLSNVTLRLQFSDDICP